jgi:uncharacterized membrane protein YkoI
VLPTAVWADEPAASLRETQKLAMAKEVLDKAAIDLGKALETAQRKVPDGKALAVRLEKKDGKARFGAYLLSGGTVKEVEIDPTTGDVVKFKDQQAGDALTDEMLAAAEKASKGALVSISQAIEIGTQKVKNGKPFEAEMKFQLGKPVIEVEMLKGETVVNVQVDATDPKMVQIKESQKK